MLVGLGSVIYSAIIFQVHRNKNAAILGRHFYLYRYGTGLQH